MVYISVPRDILEATEMSVDALKLELAITLFQQNKLSFGKARELTGMTVVDFQRLLALREIPLHYDIEEYEEDKAMVGERNELK